MYHRLPTGVDCGLTPKGARSLTFLPLTFIYYRVYLHSLIQSPHYQERAMHYEVVRNANYVNELRKVEINHLGDEKAYGDALHLYSVEVYNPNTEKQEPAIHVLAPSPDEALSQAESMFKDMDYGIRVEYAEIIKLLSNVKQIPFLIRGWSNHQF